MKKIIIILISLTVLNLLSCKKTTKQHKTDKDHTHTQIVDTPLDDIIITKAQFKDNKMQLNTLSKQAFSDVIKVTGMIDVPPQSKAIISSFYGGYIKKSNLLIGDKVKKGQAVVTIENPKFVDIQQEYLEISEQLSYLQTEYERQKTLFEEQITSQKNYLKAQSEYNRKKAKYNGLNKKLKMLHIDPTMVKQGNITSSITLYATISGSITKINVSKGSYISPSDLIMEIINTNHIHIELTAFEKDIMKIKKGQKISFKIPEASDKLYHAEVHLVGTAIDENTRTIKVHGHLHDEKKHPFAVGMFVEAVIEITSKEALGLPEDAVIEEGEHQIVLLLKSENKNYSFEKINVETGKKHNGFIEIISDKLNPSDKFLVKGGFSLVDTEGGGHSH